MQQLELFPMKIEVWSVLEKQGEFAIWDDDHKYEERL
jgi:hypothetical protein